MSTATVNIPSQVLNYANLAAFPVTGALKTIYIAEDSNLEYRWTGSAYQLLGAAGSGVQSVTGDGVNNTDPLNPVLTFPTPNEIGAEPEKGTDDNYVTDAQLVVIQNTSGTNTGDNATNTTSNTYADGKVADAINNGTTTIAPSQNAVFDALALKSAGTIIVTSGTSFTTPSNITTSTIFYIELVGGGGGGGGRSATNLSGSGGGGGGYCFVKVTGLSPSTTYTCAIGAGGSGGADGASGVDGGSTTLTIGATTYTASGGIKGVNTNTSYGGAGGTGTNGDINIEGQRGWASVAAASTAILAAQGGNSPKSWGNGGAAKYSDGAGTGNATGYGGGGSSSKFGTGGNGSNGIIYAQYIN